MKKETWETKIRSMAQVTTKMHQASTVSKHFKCKIPTKKRIAMFEMMVLPGYKLYDAWMVCELRRMGIDPPNRHKKPSSD